MCGGFFRPQASGRGYNEPKYAEKLSYRCRNRDRCRAYTAACFLRRTYKMRRSRKARAGCRRSSEVYRGCRRGIFRRALQPGERACHRCFVRGVLCPADTSCRRFSDGEFRILPLLLVCLICTAISAVCGIIGVPGEKSGRAKRRAMMKRLSAGK